MTIQVDEEPTATKRTPEFNEHGDEMLQDLGFECDRILQLEVAGAVA